MSGLIMVTGATGGLGGDVLDFLLKRVPAARLAALARKPEALSHLAERGVSVRQGDYEAPDTLVAAFQGVEKLLLVSARSFTDAKTAHRNVIRAAREAGVRHIHYTAVQRRAGSTFVLPQVTEWDAYTENELSASGLDVTVLRNSQYLDAFDMLIGEIAADRVVRVPVGRTPIALATRGDMAEATAAVLASDGHEGRGYTLTGSESFTLDDYTRIVGEITGTPVTHEQISAEDYIDLLLKAGTPGQWAPFIAAWFQAMEAGEFSPTDDVERLIGRPTTSLRTVVAQRRSG
ncbi:SDR family oxidoreductase [Streptomyces sp. NPDC055025]